jgi:hypothetical protein
LTSIIPILRATSSEPNEIRATAVDDDGNGFMDDVHGWDFQNNTNNPRPRARWRR